MQRDDAHKRPRPALAIGLVLLALTSTTTCKETPAAKVTAPKTLPAFLPEFVQWSTSARARGKAADGVKALGGNDFKRARGLLTEAVSLDPSWIAARLDLARLYVLAGHEDVAMRLLQPLSEGDEACGGCVDAFDQIARSADLQHLLASAKGKELLARVPKVALDWRRWADELSGALAHMNPEVISRYVHPHEHFELIRSCPECSNPDRRKPDKRELRGASVAVKLATRFNTERPRLGTVPLRLQGKPDCAARCCSWQLPASVTVGEAMLAKLCFRPMTVGTAALTRVEIVYGQSVNDREQVRQAEKRRQEIEGIPLPRHPPTAAVAP